MKQVLRKKLLAKRKSHPPRHSQDKNHQIAQRVFELPEFRKAKTILLYAPIYGEVETKAIFLEAVKRRKHVALPKVNGAELEAREVKSWEQLGKGAFGVLEPLRKSHALKPSEIELAFVPGIAFDEEGYRLGYGKGFYDRFLKLLGAKAKRVGLAYGFQMVKKLPRETHDEKVALVVTEEKVFRIK